MTWFKVDDGFWSHPKVLRMSAEATALWVRAGSYACQHLTDGRIDSGLVSFLGNVQAADELVANGLWVEVDGGYEFHDWDEYQETSESVKRRRELSRDRKRKQRRTAAGHFKDSRRDDEGSHDGVTRDGACDDGVSHGGSHTVPTRPDPTRPLGTDVPSQMATDADAPIADRPSKRSAGYSDEFESWWSVYPRKAGKRKAATAFTSARKRATLDELIAGARRYADDPNRVDEFTRHGATWLNGDGWLDEPEPVRSGRRSPVEGPSWFDTAAELDGGADEFALDPGGVVIEGQWWADGARG